LHAERRRGRRKRRRRARWCEHAHRFLLARKT